MMKLSAPRHCAFDPAEQPLLEEERARHGVNSSGVRNKQRHQPKDQRSPVEVVVDDLGVELANRANEGGELAQCSQKTRPSESGRPHGPSADIGQRPLEVALFVGDDAEHFIPVFDEILDNRDDPRTTPIRLDGNDDPHATSPRKTASSSRTCSSRMFSVYRCAVSMARSDAARYVGPSCSVVTIFEINGSS